jgi:hypothetical protein
MHRWPGPRVPVDRPDRSGLDARETERLPAPIVVDDMSAAMPTPRFAITPPHDATEIRRALTRVHAEGHAFALAMPVAPFFAPQGDGWSPAMHLRHLTRSTRPVAQALGIPRLLLRLRFGRVTTPSRRWEPLVSDYRAALAAGGRATARFVPTDTPTSGAPDARRTEILRSWHDCVRALDLRLSRWPEDALDAVRVPHPLLGLLTMREMLLFTVYHTAHHLRLIDARMGASSHSS